MRNAWKFYAALVAVILVVQQVAGPGVQAACAVLQIVVLIAATWLGVRTHKPCDRVFWRLVLANQTLFLAGNFTQVVTQDILGIDAYPAPADAFYVMTYLALIFGMLRIVRARNGTGRDRAAALDALVIAAGATIVCWKFWIGASVSASMPGPARVATIAYPALDIIMFALAVRCLAGRGHRPFALKLFAGTLLLLFAGDVCYGWQLSRGLYTPHNWIDLLWGGAALLAGAMALHPSMVDMTVTPATRKKPHLTRSRLGVMAAAAALAPAMQTLDGLDAGNPTQIVIACGAIAMFGGVLARAYFASRDDARANEALRVKQEELASALNVLQATQQERALLLDSVMRAGEQERMWVAAELHDGPIQQLAALGFGIDRVRRRIKNGDATAAARALEDARDDLSKVVSGLRKLMSELRPPALDESGLEGALRDYVADFRRGSGIHCSLEVDLGEERLPSEIETTVYRVSQEALLNIRRHSRARHAVLSLKRAEDSVRLCIRDDGRGFDVTQPVALERDTAHYGLVGMRERVEQRGGQWRVESRVGEGTTIDAEFPIYQPDLSSLVEVSS